MTAEKTLGADIDGIVSLAGAILDVAEKKEYKAGSFLFEEGGTDENFYILLDGKVGITKKTSEGEEKVIAELNKGEFLGEGVLSGNFHKPTGAKVTKDATVLVVSHDTFQMLIDKDPKIAVDVLQKVLEVENGRMVSMNSKLIALFEIDHLLSEFKDKPEEIAKAIVEKLIAILNADAGAVYLKVPFTENYRTLFSSTEDLNLENLQGFDLKETGKKTQRNNHYLTLSLEEVGAIVLKNDKEFEDDDVRLMTLIADQLGSAMENSNYKASDKAKKLMQQQRITL